MVDSWAVLLRALMISAGLLIIIFYIIPLQAKLVLLEKDWLTGLRWRLLMVSAFIALAAAPIITNSFLHTVGINDYLLNNISTIATGASFLAFSISLVSVYHYKKKE